MCAIPERGHVYAAVVEVLQGAAKRDNFEIAQETIKNNAGIDVNSQDGLGNTVLHYLCVLAFPSVRY